MPTFFVRAPWRPRRRRSVPAKAAAGAYTLPCDPGSYTLTGTAASLERGYEVQTDPGSYALTGAASSLEQGYEIQGDPGSYTLTGTAASLKQGYEVVADQGSYTLTGTSASLLSLRRVTADQGVYTLSGQSAALEVGRLLVCASGSYSLSGTDAALSRAKTILCTPGSYAMTGASVVLTWPSAEILARQIGSYLRPDNRLSGSLSAGNRQSGSLSPGNRLSSNLRENVAYEKDFVGDSAIYRREDVYLTFEHLTDDTITDQSLAFELYRGGYEGTRIVRKTTSASEITFPAANSIRVHLAGGSTASSDTNVDPKKYYYTVSRLDSGEKVVLAYGLLEVKPPRVGEE